MKDYHTGPSKPTKRHESNCVTVEKEKKSEACFTNAFDED